MAGEPSFEEFKENYLSRDIFDRDVRNENN